MNISEEDKIRKKASKYIFVRDIYKNWCIEGINAVIDSQDKLIDHLREITEGYPIITVGSSAGGYMAILFGIMLHAEEVIALSPQVSLYEYNNYHPINYFDQYVNDSHKSKYFDLTEMIRSFKGNIFFFYANQCSEDIAQYRKIEEVGNVYVFSIHGENHGAALYGIGIISTLVSSTDRLKKLAQKYDRKNIHPDWYLIGVSGLRNGIPAVCKEWVKRIIRRIKC